MGPPLVLSVPGSLPLIRFPGLWSKACLSPWGGSRRSTGTKLPIPALPPRFTISRPRRRCSFFRRVYQSRGQHMSCGWSSGLGSLRHPSAVLGIEANSGGGCLDPAGREHPFALPDPSFRYSSPTSTAGCSRSMQQSLCSPVASVAHPNPHGVEGRRRVPPPQAGRGLISPQPLGHNPAPFGIVAVRPAECLGEDRGDEVRLDFVAVPARSASPSTKIILTGSPP